MSTSDNKNDLFTQEIDSIQWEMSIPPRCDTTPVTSHVIHSLYNKENPVHCRFWISDHTQPLLEGMVQISVVSPSEHVYRMSFIILLNEETSL